MIALMRGIETIAQSHDMRCIFKHRESVFVRKCESWSCSDGTGYVRIEFEDAAYSWIKFDSSEAAFQWSNARVFNVIPHQRDMLEYTQGIIDTWGSWELYQYLVKSELDAAEQFDAITIADVRDEIESMWNFEWLYNDTVAADGQLCLGKYRNIVPHEAFDNDPDADCYWRRIEIWESEMSEIAESYGMNFDVYDGNVWLYAGVDYD